jgi:hypothetical protein
MHKVFINNSFYNIIFIFYLDCCLGYYALTIIDPQTHCQCSNVVQVLNFFSFSINPQLVAINPICPGSQFDGFPEGPIIPNDLNPIALRYPFITVDGRPDISLVQLCDSRDCPNLVISDSNNYIVFFFQTSPRLIGPARNYQIDFCQYSSTFDNSGDCRPLSLPLNPLTITNTGGIEIKTSAATFPSQADYNPRFYRLRLINTVEGACSEIRSFEIQLLTPSYPTITIPNNDLQYCAGDLIEFDINNVAASTKLLSFRGKQRSAVAPHTLLMFLFLFYVME